MLDPNHDQILLRQLFLLHLKLLGQHASQNEDVVKSMTEKKQYNKKNFEIKMYYYNKYKCLLFP
jgi:hypothetical protein